MSVRILIADPDEYLLDAYREHLEQRGCEVLTATNGLACIEKLRKCCPDVLVLEPSLPWGWGDGVLAVMHDEPNLAGIPVIVLTHGRDRSVLYQMAPFHIDDYLYKPVTAKNLAGRILAIVRRQQLEVAPRESRG